MEVRYKKESFGEVVMVKTGNEFHAVWGDGSSSTEKCDYREKWTDATVLFKSEREWSFGDAVTATDHPDGEFKASNEVGDDYTWHDQADIDKYLSLWVHPTRLVWTKGMTW